MFRKTNEVHVGIYLAVYHIFFIRAYVAVGPSCTQQNEEGAQSDARQACRHYSTACCLGYFSLETIA